MARRRRKSKIGLPSKRKISPEEQKRQDMHARAFAGTVTGPRYGFTTKHLGKSECCVFRAPFAAKMYLDLMIGGEEIEWENDTLLRTESGLVLTGPKLRQIFDYVVKAKEEKYFSLSDEYYARVALMRSDQPHRGFTPGESYGGRRKRHSRKGMFKMAEIADELGMDQRACRAELRRQKVKKPEHGWAWQTREEVEEIKQLITGRRTVRVDLSRAVQPEE